MNPKQIQDLAAAEIRRIELAIKRRPSHRWFEINVALERTGGDLAAWARTPRSVRYLEILGIHDALLFEPPDGELVLEARTDVGRRPSEGLDLATGSGQNAESGLSFEQIQLMSGHKSRDLADILGDPSLSTEQALLLRRRADRVLDKAMEKRRAGDAVVTDGESEIS